MKLINIQHLSERIGALSELDKQVASCQTKRMPKQIILHEDDRPKEHVTPEYTLRGWQLDAFSELNQSPYALIQAFCGSGKTILQVFLAVNDAIQTNYNQKQLIVVPQSHIANGFCGTNSIKCKFPNNKKYTWQIQQDNFTFKEPDTTKRLKNWLLKPPHEVYRYKDIYINGAVCTYQALALAWKEIEKELGQNGQLQAIQNLTLRIDEGHHINWLHCYNEVAEKQLSQSSTIIGSIASFILNNKQSLAKLCLTSATMFRGDKDSILLGGARKEFTPYFLDFIKHYRTLKLDGFQISFSEYNDNPIQDTIKRIKSEPNEKHFVVIPSRGSRWRTIQGDEYLKLVNELTNSGLRVLDWVYEEEQDANKKLVFNEPNGDGGKSNIDVIVTCMLGREGTDWVPCSRIHNLATENSVTMALQIMGRAFRKFPGKKDVKVYYNVRKFSKNNKRELFSDRINAMLIAMQANEMICPIKLPKIPGQPRSWTLSEYFGDKNDSINEDLIKGYEGLDKNGTDKQKQEAINELIECILNKHQLPESDKKFLLTALQTRLKRLVSKMRPKFKTDLYRDQSVDTKFVRKNGFDLVKDGGSIFFADCDQKELIKLRNIFVTHRNKLLKFSDRPKIKKQQKYITPRVYPVMTQENIQIASGKRSIDKYVLLKRPPNPYVPDERNDYYNLFDRLDPQRHKLSEKDYEVATVLYEYAESKGCAELFPILKNLSIA